MWGRLKDWATGMTEQEREVYAREKDLRKLTRILDWNEELDRRNFEEGTLRAQIKALEREIAALRRKLPRESRDKAFGVDDRMSHYYQEKEVADHIRYLEDALVMNRGNPRFPVYEARIRLNILRDQLNNLRMMDEMQRRQYQYRPPPPYRPAVPIWSSSSRGFNPRPGFPFTPPSGPAVPISPSSSSSSEGFSPPSGQGFNPPTGQAVPISPSSSSSSEGFGPPSGQGFGPPPNWGGTCGRQRITRPAAVKTQRRQGVRRR